MVIDSAVHEYKNVKMARGIKNINSKIKIENLLFNKQKNMMKKKNQILINNNIFKCKMIFL